MERIEGEALPSHILMQYLGKRPTMSNGGSNITIAPTSQPSLVTFQIDGGSVLEPDGCQLTWTATFANTGQYIYIPAYGCSFIARMVLRTASNVILMELTEADLFSSVVGVLGKKEDLFADSGQGLSTNVGMDLCNANYWSTINGGQFGSITASPNYSPAYVVTSGLTAAISVNYMLDMSKLKHTIFENKSLMYLPESLYVDLTYNQGTNIAYNSSSATTGVTGTAIVDNITISNLYLRPQLLAADPAVNELFLSLKTLATSGDGLNVDYEDVQTYQRPYTASSTEYDNIIISNAKSAYHKTLKRLYWTIFEQSSNYSARYSHSPATLLVSNYQALLNGLPLSPSPIDVSAYEDWQLQRKKLKGTPCVNYLTYKNIWVHIDAFDSKGNRICEYSQDDLSGYPFEGNMTYQVNANYSSGTHPNTLHYLISVMPRRLRISNAIISVQ